MLVLHHHQRAGAQVAPPLARDVERIIRQNYAQGLQLLHHRRQFRPQQGLGAHLRPPDLHPPEKLNIGFIIQVDTLCHKIPNFVEKREGRACDGSLSASRTSTRTTCSPPRSGRTRLPNTVRCCWRGRSAKVMTFAGYILGFPADTPELIMNDIDDDQARAAARPARFFF